MILSMTEIEGETVDPPKVRTQSTPLTHPPPHHPILSSCAGHTLGHIVLTVHDGLYFTVLSFVAVSASGCRQSAEWKLSSVEKPQPLLVRFAVIPP